MFQTSHIGVTVIQVYAPIENSENVVKDEFYEGLKQAMDETPRFDLEIVMGHFNAKLGGTSDRIGKSCRIFHAS